MLAVEAEPRRIVVFVPNWVGDAVMFTPTLRAIRARFRDSQITLFARPAPAAVLTPNPWTGNMIVDRGGFIANVRWLRRGRFELAVLGPNSFRSGLLARLGGAARRLGYSRGGRGALLTDKLDPPRDTGGTFAVVPALDYYLRLAEHLGCDVADKRMELAVADADAARADSLLSQAQADTGRPIVILNPGASFGSSKMYPAERFARVADALIERRGAQIVISAAPAERPVANAVQEAMSRSPLINLGRVGNTLGLLKAMVRRSDLMITNDTGPRHFAAAFNVPVVAIFGATDPERTTIYYDRERIVRVDVPCGPCQRKQCPLPPGPRHHQCMLKIPPEMVLAATEALLGQGRAS
ncbi:MAG: hypothetical protein AMJ81_03075 [Phycisphaerae bacterium SM23_33]|nr:MAG: hypothetical protein AMJ81_03075 [Phycisphaerae bacterium SM23_33]